MNAQIEVLVTQLSSQIEINSNGVELHSIVASLGGIQNVVQLCLTHPDSDERLCQNVLSSLRKLVAGDTTTNDVAPTMKNVSTLHSVSSIDSSNLSESYLQTPTSIVPKPTSLQTVPTIEISNEHSNNVGSRNDIIMADTKGEFYNSFIVFNANCANNMYFKLFSKKTANWLMNLVIFNKWFAITISVIACIIALISELLKATVGSRGWVYLMLRCTFGVCAVVVPASVIFTMNFSIMIITRNTFDFWFKMWNLLAWQVSFAWINFSTTNRSAVDLIATMFTVALVFPTLFLLDAVPSKYKRKRAILVSFAMFFGVAIISAYFSYEDVYYNPLKAYNIQQATISLKGIFLGSYVNMLLFIAKPALGDIGRWTLKQYTKACGYDKNLQGVNKKGVKKHKFEHLVSIYSRPQIKWYQVDASNGSRVSVNLL